MSKFNHAYSVAFEVYSDKGYATDVTQEMLREGLIKRIRMLDEENGWEEACDKFDSYKRWEDEL